MIDSILKNEHAGSFSRRQQLFFKYTYFVLIDLAVLNLFNEYWSNVFIESFSISLLTALLLQVLLQATIAIEHRVANIFKNIPLTSIMPNKSFNYAYFSICLPDFKTLEMEQQQHFVYF